MRGFSTARTIIASNSRCQQSQHYLVRECKLYSFWVENFREPEIVTQEPFVVFERLYTSRACFANSAIFVRRQDRVRHLPKPEHQKRHPVNPELRCSAQSRLRA